VTIFVLGFVNQNALLINPEVPMRHGFIDAVGDVLRRCPHGCLELLQVHAFGLTGLSTFRLLASSALSVRFRWPRAPDPPLKPLRN
jgi:hypothetical protein